MLNAAASADPDKPALGVPFSKQSARSGGFVAPEKIRFRYILEGQDPEWKEVVNYRRAHYSNLPHGRYRFRVQASNNSGVWNEKGAVLQFAIAPAYYETRWFQALCAAAIVGLFWTAHRLHVRHVVRQLNLTVEARVDERTRIARELHDTLLQGFQGLLLMFESALKRRRPARNATTTSAG
jgi:signal transduction histidine kinase